MRRVLLISSVLALVCVAAACRHDGRTLRAPRPDQNLSISTSTTAGASIGDPGIEDIETDVSGGIPVDFMTVTAPWREGAPIDERYTCDGLNVSPALSWSAAPEGTAEIAITMTDIDAPDFVHWVVAGIAPSEIAVAEATVPLGAVEGLNGSGASGYTGPCPPSGSTHTYLITVHYLGEQSGLEDGSDATDMVERIDGITLASAEVTGVFSRP